MKVGDTVERIKGHHNGMRTGYTDVVVESNGLYSESSVRLKKYGRGHTRVNLKIINTLSWRERIEC